jgi:hypothetical protein
VEFQINCGGYFIEFSGAFSISESAVSGIGWQENNELERIWKKVVVEQLK